MHRTLQGPGERHAGLWIRPCRACYVQHHSTICTPSATQRLEPPWHAIAMRCVRLALQLCRSALAVSQPYSPRTPLTFPHVSMHIRGGYGAEEQEFCGSAERGVISVVLYHSNSGACSRVVDVLYHNCISNLISAVLPRICMPSTDNYSTVHSTSHI